MRCARNEKEGMDPMSDYEVGYGRPPKAGQFRKGQSGNPKGRPKSQLSLAGSVQKAISKKVRVKTGQGERKLAKLDAMIEGLMNDALKGDARARSELLKLMRDIDLEAQLKAKTEAQVQDLEPEDLAILARMRGDLDDEQAAI